MKRCIIVILTVASKGEKNMDFHRRMQAAMLIIIIVCMMCVSTVLAREEELARAGEEQKGTGVFITCETKDTEPDM